MASPTTNLPSGPIPAILADSSASANMASYLCNLTFATTSVAPNEYQAESFTPFLDNCTAPLVANGQPELIELVQNGTASFGVGVTLDEETDGSSVDFVRPFYLEMGDGPMGIVVRKGERARDLQLVSSIQAGLVSTLWGKDRSVAGQIAEIDGANTQPLKFPVAAVSGFLTEGGLSLSYENTPQPSGSLQTPSRADPVDVTIAVYRGDALPLANITGDSIDQWSGIEVEMINSICATPGPLNCVDIITVDTLDDRLAVVNNGTASISIGEIVVTQSRLDTTNFVQPFYYSAGPGLYVLEEDTSLYPADATLDVMNGKPVCTITDSAWNPVAESYGAQLVSFDTRAEADKAVEDGTCIGLLWDSPVDFQDPPYREVASDVTKSKPIGFAVSTDIGAGVYSYLSALSAEWMASGSNSPILQWERENKETAKPNVLLGQVVDAITYFEPQVPDGPGTSGSAATSTAGALLLTLVAAMAVALA